MKHTYFSIKNIILAAGVLLFHLTTNAQLINNGTTITVSAGAILFAQSDITNSTNGIITNDGTIAAAGNFVNAKKATLSGDGIYSVQGNFTNTGTYNADNSILEFYGNVNSNLKNTNSNIYILQVNKNTNKNVILQGNTSVLNSVIFLADKNYIKLGKNNLTLENTATVQNFSDKRYFITNGTGALTKKNISNTAFTFPLGFDNKTYNAVTITEKGTIDDYSVQALKHALKQGSTGNPITADGIDASWYIQEAIPGGANATIEANWKNTDELSNFDYTKCMVVRYAGTRWDFNQNKTGAATGTTYRFISRTGFSSLGNFTVISKNNPLFSGSAFQIQNKTTGINTNSEAVIKVYPTLVQQKHITVDVLSGLKNIEKMSIKITDVNGKIVYQKQDTDFQPQQITLPNLAQGIYFVNIIYDTKKFVQKIIVSK